MKVVFDLDGVLLNSESDLSWLKRALSKTLREFGIENTKENRCKLYPKEVKNFKETSKEFKVNPKDLWRSRNQHYINEKIKAIKTEEIKPFPYVNSIYKLEKHTLGIISNSPQKVVDIFIKHFNYKDLFDAGIGRGSKLSDLKYIKPNPHLYEKLKQKIGSGKYIYVGDTENDRKFADNTGMKFLHLTRNDNGFKNLKDIIQYINNDK